MKLYATVASERATKGQGGNRFLDIEIFTTSRERPSHHVHVTLSPDNGEAIVSLSALHFGVDRILASDSVFLNIEKGKQQKGGHQHNFIPTTETSGGEVIEWCTGCEATRDSYGGIVE